MSEVGGWDLDFGGKRGGGGPTNVVEGVRVGVDAGGVADDLHPEPDRDDDGVHAEAAGAVRLDEERDLEEQRDAEEGGVDGDVGPVAPVREHERAGVDGAFAAAGAALGERALEAVEHAREGEAVRRCGWGCWQGHHRRCGWRRQGHRERLDWMSRDLDGQKCALTASDERLLGSWLLWSVYED